MRSHNVDCILIKTAGSSIITGVAPFFVPQKQAALRLPYKRVVDLRLVEPELSTEHLSAYYIGFIACGLSCILFVLLAVIRFFCYHRSTHLIYNFTMTKVSAAKVR